MLTMEPEAKRSDPELSLALFHGRVQRNAVAAHHALCVALWTLQLVGVAQGLRRKLGSDSADAFELRLRTGGFDLAGSPCGSPAVLAAPAATRGCMVSPGGRLKSVGTHGAPGATRVDTEGAE